MKQIDEGGRQGALRVADIERYDVLGRAPRTELLAIVELAAKVSGTSMATINLITDTEQHQVATYGFAPAVCSRAESMCAAVLDEDTPLVVPDASLDPRFENNPFVTGAIGKVRFYASHKLVTLSGTTIGTLCVFDDQPRDAGVDTDALATLADRIVDVLELSWRSRQLAASNERLSAFAGRVSHDLKTPLASLTLALGLLREELAGETGTGADGVGWLLDRAIDGSERMAAMINEVLSYASLGGGLQLDEVPLGDLVADVLQDLVGALEGVTIRYDDLPVVRADRQQLHAVFLNAIDNAAKYRDPSRALVVNISTEEVDGRWHVRIADNGRGVPEEDRARVFDLRVRLSADGGGSGIGLDTCRRVVQAHGGTIGLDETPGGGTTLWFELPV